MNFDDVVARLLLKQDRALRFLDCRWLSGSVRDIRRARVDARSDQYSLRDFLSKLKVNRRTEKVQDRCHTVGNKQSHHSDIGPFIEDLEVYVHVGEARHQIL